MATLKGQAICVRVWDWSETSQTVSLLVRDHGLIRGIAKGAKREKSAYSGGFELLTLGEVVLIAKPANARLSAGDGGATPLATITAWDLQEIFPAIRQTLPAFHAAMYMADLAQHLVSERDPHPGLYDALAQGLRALERLPSSAVLLRFQWSALVDVGVGPQVRRDVVTGEPIDASRQANFSPGLGGLTHDAATAGRRGESWPIRPETARVLVALASLEEPNASRVAPASAVEGATRLLAMYARCVLGRELPSEAPAMASFQEV
jgi:DNA repair protein RecO (recombination protein O)